MVKVPMPLDPAARISGDEEGVKRKSDYLQEYTDKIREAHIQMQNSNLDGFSRPVSLRGLFSEVVLKRGCSLEYEREVKKLLTEASCSDVPVRHSTIRL